MNFNWGMIVLVVVVIAILILYSKSKESFTVDEQEKMDISQKVSKYIKPDTNYVDYLKFLVENKNKSYILVKNDTFYELRILSKNNNLTASSVYSYIKNEK